MKSILFTSFLAIASFNISAQTLPVKLNKVQPNYVQGNASPGQLTSTTDTIDVYILRATSGTFYQSLDGGYIFGTSYYYDGSSGQYFPVSDETGIGFDAIGNANVTDILFWAGAKQITGNADSITGKVYAVGVDSMPTTLLGSGRMSMLDVDTALTGAAFTDIAITNGSANITSSFFISIAYAGNDDTLGLVSTGAGDGMLEKRVRLKASPEFGGTWIRMGELYPFLDVDLFYAPVVTLSGVGVDEHFTLSDATLDAVYPTIATSEIHFDYSLNSSSSVSYYLFDMRGKKYFEQNKEQQGQGAYSQSFDVSKLANGNYFLSVNINGKTVTQKVVVQK